MAFAISNPFSGYDIGTTTGGLSTASAISAQMYWSDMGALQLQRQTWITDNPTVQAGVSFANKRRRLFGRKQKEGTELEAKVVFKLIKKGLSKQKQAKFKQLAEQAFEAAVKYQKIGQTKVSKEFQTIFERNLKIAAVLAEGYETMVHEQQVQRYIEKLPKNKELVIDELDEYDKPIPPKIVKKVEVAKDAKVFDKFVVFWIREVKDPIIFGQIKEEPNFFYFVGEWDDDISVDDLLKIKVK